MTRWPIVSRKVLRIIGVSVPLLIFFTVLHKNRVRGRTDGDPVRRKDSDVSGRTSDGDRQSAGSCLSKTICPDDHFSFYVQSGAANVVAPKICVQNRLVLGTVMNNAGVGINVVVINGKSGSVLRTGHFNMYSGDVKPLVDFLQSIEKDAAVLMASYDEPSSKLSKDARQLISDLGSAAVHSLGFRDNWVFVGGGGALVRSSFEKHLKNDLANNKYENWPELIVMDGCLPKQLD
ncbi:protein FAM3C-like isoform X2 [Embiotoca jacksoni]|uniref:protein FAM3C-like isoform X2 n=1 Tax=Embiotoca jacksoni TaxID=100190 RepID=UPI003704899D